MTRTAIITATALITLLTAPQATLAQSARGMAELRGQVEFGVDGDVWLLAERFRPEVRVPLSERVVFSLTVEAMLRQGRHLGREIERALSDSDLAPALEAGCCRFPTHENDFLRISRAGDYLAVERLFLDVYLPWLDLRVGRQAVNWGSALLVNPTDPFPEVLLTEPWRFRSGVNAVTATAPVGDRHDVRVVVGSDDAFTAVRAAARGRMNFGTTDIALVGAYRQETLDGLAGLDIRGTLGIGFWLEAAVVFNAERAHEQVTVGADYSFPVLDSLQMSLQYYRNGRGTARTRGGALTGGHTAALLPVCAGDGPFPRAHGQSDPFAPVFTGTDYGLLSIALAALPELNISLLWLQNLRDGTALLVPTVVTHPFGRLEVALSAQIPIALWGGGGELRPRAGDTALQVPWQDDIVTVTLDGLVPSATLALWARYHF